MILLNKIKEKKYSESWGHNSANLNNIYILALSFEHPDESYKGLKGEKENKNSHTLLYLYNHPT